MTNVQPVPTATVLQYIGLFASTLFPPLLPLHCVKFVAYTFGKATLFSAIFRCCKLYTAELKIGTPAPLKWYTRESVANATTNSYFCWYCKIVVCTVGAKSC